MTVIDVSMLGKWVDENSSTLSIDFCQKYCQTVKVELICNDNDTDKFVESFYQQEEPDKKEMEKSL
ncbi:MAG: hypothetical protein U5K00_04190 [Melioribacteraceae bacterium]|nr:hypothetical protein [Melioribacteraceae bacterium]